jgi:hypothetical protein
MWKEVNTPKKLPSISEFTVRRDHLQWKDLRRLQWKRWYFSQL